MFDMKIVVAYPPPGYDKHAEEGAARAAREVMKWVAGEMREAPQRCLPFLAGENLAIENEGLENSTSAEQIHWQRPRF